ncbi:MAG TPA: HNH endonuclease [Bryobacteraceae bacterium]|jgi:5-methylcytosine-specific restriction endonuclease McrA
MSATISLNPQGKEHQQAKSHVYYERNKERILARIKKYKKKHPEVARRHSKRWYRQNVIQARFYDSRVKAKKHGATGTHTFQQWLDLKAKYLFCCLACDMKEPFTDQKVKHLTEDHIVPLSRGGSHNIDNIQPLCFRCNNEKRTKSIDYRNP